MGAWRFIILLHLLLMFEILHGRTNKQKTLTIQGQPVALEQQAVASLHLKAVVRDCLQGVGGAQGKAAFGVFYDSQ